MFQTRQSQNPHTETTILRIVEDTFQLSGFVQEIQTLLQRKSKMMATMQFNGLN